MKRASHVDNICCRLICQPCCHMNVGEVWQLWLTIGQTFSSLSLPHFLACFILCLLS